MKTTYERYGTNRDLEIAGFWHSVSPTERYLLARAGGTNVKFAKAVERVTRPYRDEIDDELNEFDLDLANSLMIEAFVEAVLLGWQGVTGPDGQEMPFTAENATKLLTDLPELFGKLRDQATKIANYQTKQVETDAGN